MAKEAERMKNIQTILESFRSCWTPEYRHKVTEEELMGHLMSSYFRWDGLAILKSTREALEDSNFHTDNQTIDTLIAKYE